jgi:hypothetical protein
MYWKCLKVPHILVGQAHLASRNGQHPPMTSDGDNIAVGLPGTPIGAPDRMGILKGCYTGAFNDLYASGSQVLSQVFLLIRVISHTVGIGQYRARFT